MVHTTGVVYLCLDCTSAWAWSLRVLLYGASCFPWQFLYLARRSLARGRCSFLKLYCAEYESPKDPANNWWFDLFSFDHENITEFLYSEEVT